MREKKVFSDTYDLWQWLYLSSKMFDSKISDRSFANAIDKQFDNVCHEIRRKGYAIRHNTIITLLKMGA